MTDIRLDTGNQQDTIVLDAVHVVSNGSTLEIKNPANTLTPTPRRRALVHTDDDGLSINHNGDYPAGATIEGTTTISGDEKNGMFLDGVRSISGAPYAALHPAIPGDGPEPIDPAAIPATGFHWSTSMYIAGEIRFQETPFVLVGLPGLPLAPGTSLQDTIKKLKDRIAALEAKLGI